MKLTRASSYALHAVAYMAQQKNGDRPVASHKIAQERDIPERFLLKVLKPLVEAKVLVSVKGPNGGYRLARPASEISLLEIVEAVDNENKPLKGEAPDPRDRKENLEFNKKYPDWDPAPTLPLYHRLGALCQQIAEGVRKQLEKIKVSELIKK